MQAGHQIVAITHHTTILALRALLEARPVTDLIEEARAAKTPSVGVLRYELAAGRFTMTAVMTPP